MEEPSMGRPSPGGWGRGEKAQDRHASVAAPQVVASSALSQAAPRVAPTGQSP